MQLFCEFLRSPGAVFDRGHLVGHLTGSAWLVSSDGERVLLIHHRKLGRWLQLGWHADGDTDTDLVRVVLREAEEESGLSNLMIELDIFDLDCHRIPARGEEPEHSHYDVRYVVRVTKSEAFSINEEGMALAWKPIAEIAIDVGLDKSLCRMSMK